MVDKQRYHIEWIDGAKGIAILWVILEHCLPNLDKLCEGMHIGQAVPVFVFITSYLISLHFSTFKEYFTLLRLKKMLLSILPPFLLVLVCEFLFYFIHTGELLPLKTLILAGGCMGPGAYYLHIYIAMWLLLPGLIVLIRKTNIYTSFFLMLFISVACEYFYAMLVDGIPYPSRLYRLLPIRYFMVMWMGAAYPKFKDSQKNILVALALISGIILYMTNYAYDIRPFFVPPFWRDYHWYTAFYCFLFILLLKKFSYSETIQWLGKHSWSIMCFQMFVFYMMELRFN